MNEPKKIQVALFHRKRNKMTVTDFVRLPNEGDLIWLNFRCFKVEKIVHSYTQNEQTTDPNNKYMLLAPYWTEAEIFIDDVPPEEARKYWVGDKHDWDRDDFIGHMSRERLWVDQLSYDAKVSIDEYDTLMTIVAYVPDDRLSMFPEKSEHQISFEDGSPPRTASVLYRTKKEISNFTEVVLLVKYENYKKS